MNYKVKNDKLLEYVKGTYLEDYIGETFSIETTNQFEEFISKNISEINILYHEGDYDDDYEYAIEIVYANQNGCEIYDYVTHDFIQRKRDLLEVKDYKKTLEYVEEKITNIQIELNEISDLILEVIK